jgi:hypothetical protein
MPLKATTDELEKCTDFSCLFNELLPTHGGRLQNSCVGVCLSPICLDKPAYKKRYEQKSSRSDGSRRNPFD